MDAAMIARVDRFVTVLGRHGFILADAATAALALGRVDMIDRVGAAPVGSIARHRHRVAAAARTLFADYDELPEGSPVRGAIARMVGAAVAAAR